MLRLSRSLAAIAALFVSLALPAVAADRAIVVFDASGSMWGQIDGKAKIDIARDTLKTALQSLPQDLELGLMVYGHRDKGSCEDIELMVPPAAGTSDAINQAVAGIRPKGKTPISASVRQAAEELKYTEDKATVILVTDGLETCNADPCALADELEQNGVDFTAHVVGFNLSKEESDKISCLATKTGGQYFKADNAGELGEALAKTVAAVAAPPPVPEPEPVPAKPAAPDFNLTASATLAEGGEPFTKDDLFWEVRLPPAADGTPGESVFNAYGGPLKASVPAGDYVVSARLADVKIDIPVTVTADKVTDQDFVLNAGFIHVNAKRSADGEVEENARLDALYGTQDATGYGEGKFYVPAGDVEITAEIGSSKASEKLTVKAGEFIDKTLIAASGVAAVNAVYAPGGDAVSSGSIFFSVQRPTVSPDGSREEVTNGYGANYQFDLAPGDYNLHVRMDVAEADAPFTVKAGERTEVLVNINAGVLNAKANGKYRLDVVSAKKNIEGKRKEFTSSYDQDYTVTLPEGSYVLVVYPDDTLNNPVEMPFTIKAGERTELSAN